jgi:protein-S-isoprenylcysteine O-methyltransferase Ste14
MLWRVLAMSGAQREQEPPHRRRALPPLGRRGGGWVAAQVVLMAAILLSALVGLSWPDPLEPAAYAVGALLLALGAGLVGAGGVGLGTALTAFPAPRGGKALQTTGIYGRARHPMYGGGILIALGWSAIFATVIGLALTAVLALLLELKSRREELWLEQMHADYDDYRRRTRRRFIPFVW